MKELKYPVEIIGWGRFADKAAMDRTQGHSHLLHVVDNCGPRFPTFLSQEILRLFSPMPSIHPTTFLPGADHRKQIKIDRAKSTAGSTPID